MNDYFNKLRTETNWLKLFIPIFIGMTILLVFFTPIVMYIIEVIIKKNEYGEHPISYAIIISLIYSIILSGVISYRHKKEKSKTDQTTDDQKKTD